MSYRNEKIQTNGLIAVLIDEHAIDGNECSKIGSIKIYA